MESEKENINMDNEIDLYDLYLIIRKRTRMVFSFIVISVFATGISTYIIPPVYSGSFVVRVPAVSFTEKTPLVSLDEVENHLKILESLRKEKRLSELAGLLDIGEEKLKKVVSLRTNPLKNDNALMEVTVDISDPILMGELKESITGYLNHNRYVSERLSLKREGLIALKDEIKGKVGKIEDLRDSITTQIRQEKIRDLGFDPLVMESDIINLRQRLKDLEIEIKMLKGFEVTAEPIVPEKPISPKKALNITIAGVTSLFLGILLAFFMERVEKRKSEAV